MSSFDDRDLLYGVKLKRDGGNVGFVPNRSESFQARANGVPKMGVRAWVSPHLPYDTRATVTGVVRDWDKAEDIPYKNANGGEGHTMPIRGSRRRPQLFQQDLFLQQPPSTLRQRSNSDIALSELDVEVTSISGSVPKNTTMSGLLHREYGSTSSIESRTVCTGNTRWFLPAHRGQSKTGFLEVLNSTPPGKTTSQDGLDEVGFEGAQAILARRKDRRSKSDAGDQSILLKRRSKGDVDVVKAEGGKSQDNAGTENRLLVCRRAFAHFDVQSVIFGLLGSPDESCASMYARNMSTGASAASQSAKGQLKDTTVAGSSLEELNLKQEEECHDHGDGKSNEIVKSCPFFRNELGGEGERQVGLSRANAGCVNSVGIRPTIELPLYYCRTNCSLSVLEGPRDGNLLRREKPKRYVIEHVDLGARYYRDYFYGRDHQNYFGVDEDLGPLALSICREKVEESGDAGPEYSYRLIVRTRELYTLRGSVPEPVVPSTSRHGTTRGLPHRDILEYAVPDLPLSGLKLAQATPHVTDQLLRLDEQGLSYQHKIGIMYCKTGQSTEEEMYNNEVAGPAFDEFLDMLGERVRLKGFDKYRAQLDNKMDSTGTHSLYTLHGDYEIMFHVSTMLPHTPNNRQQLLRKRHIGNDIVTIVFQEAGALPFTPQHIRSQFQHVFIVVRAHDPCTEHTTYSLAVARSRDVPVFGPPFPSGARFSRSHAFRDFLLAKAINGENAAHKAEKFVAMATRTRLEYMRELAEKHVTAVALAEPSASVLGALISWGGRRKEKVAAQSDIMLNTPGCLAWSVVIQDYSSGTNMDCLLAVSSAYVALIEQCSRTLVFHCSCQDILGWSSSEQSLKLFYGRGECIVMPHIHEDDVKEFVQRLQLFTHGCETEQLTLLRNSLGQLGFHVNAEGIVAEVEEHGFAWSTGLRQGSRLVEICTVAVATLSHEQMIDLLRTSVTVRVSIVPPLFDGKPRRAKTERYLPVFEYKVNNNGALREIQHSARNDHPNKSNPRLDLSPAGHVGPAAHLGPGRPVGLPKDKSTIPWSTSLPGCSGVQPLAPQPITPASGNADSMLSVPEGKAFSGKRLLLRPEAYQGNLPLEPSCRRPQPQEIPSRISPSTSETNFRRSPSGGQFMDLTFQQPSLTVAPAQNNVGGIFWERPFTDRTPMQMERIAQEAGEGVRRPKEPVAALKHLDAPGQSSRVGMSRARRDIGMADSPSRQTQGADSFYSSPSSSNTLSSTASSRHSDERWFGSGDHTDPASGTEGTEYHTSGGVVVDQGTVTTTSTDSGIDLPPARATNGRSNGVHSRVSHQHIRGKSWTGGSTGLGFTSDDKGNGPRSGDCYSVESRATLSSPHNPSKSSSSSEDSHCTLVAGQQPLHITSTSTDSQKVSSSRKRIQGPSNTEAIRMSSSDGGSSSSGLGQTRLRASVRDLRSPKKSQLNSSMVEDLMKLITPDSPEPYPLANDSRERRLSLPRSPLASPFNRIMPRTLSDESICSGRRLSDRQRYEEQQSELAEDLAITISSSGPQTSWMHSTFSPYESQHHELLLSLPNQGDSLPLPLPDETSHLEWSSLVRAAQQFEATRTLETRPREPSQVPITRRSPGWSQPTLGCGDGMSPEVLFDKVSYLEGMMKQMRDDLRKEKESKAILQSEVQNLRLDNQRLQHENKMSAKQLQRITKMFQDSRDRK